MTSPTIQRRRLGLALKRYREVAGKTQDEAAEVIDSAASKISRLEQGQSGIKLTDLTLLLDFYQVDASEADSLKQLARAGRQRGRWSGRGVPDWFRQYLDLEADATEIKWYQHEVIPGIFQTEEYIRAMLQTGQPRVSDEEIENLIAVRLARQSILDDRNKKINAILSESALRRVVGAETVMKNALIHLANIARNPHVTLQVLPFNARSVGDAWAHFILLRFGEDTSDVVYLDGYNDADYIDKPEDVRAYARLWDRLQAAATGPVESRTLILKIAQEMEDAA
ncbi:helix-turn-helix domain-containing protein [Nocardia cyriacigeorgica]|uniref:helix-turn-helix domain-containing protein n=1 Tax=Nocardia cyriacigeorgica TaxID=135487 RepID=UPI00245466CE|nr:helix-turn-helix transcriptional regulator [Nocardia cyriacigeorgica]BDU05928.1 transcriptional regulator [Nocardia cyriacigeorgica]